MRREDEASQAMRGEIRDITPHLFFFCDTDFPLLFSLICFQGKTIFLGVCECMCAYHREREREKIGSRFLSVHRFPRPMEDCQSFLLVISEYLRNCEIYLFFSFFENI